MRVFVTGAGGQVGLELCNELASSHELHASDVFHPPGTTRLPFDWHRLDVTDLEAVEAVLARVRPDRVYHLAAVLSARGERDPQHTYLVNQTGTYNVLEACRRLGIPQVMFTSTIAVFGPGLPNPVGDDVPLHPTTMYGVTKAAGEMLGEYYHRRYGLDFRGVRFPGLISASIPGGGSSDYALFMYLEGLRSGAYEAFCRADTTIPFMYMPDGLRALIELSEAPRSALTRCIYNITAFSPSAADIAASVERALPGTQFSFRSDPDRQRILDSWPRELDDSNARRDWGWKPRYGLDAMTEDLLPKVRQLGASVPFSHA